MCGIAGYLSFDGSPVDEPLLARMIATLHHRGPDAGGTWCDAAAGLASRRLAIIDLSARGHMPMANEDGSLHIVFNGEIYNFQALRRELQARGHRLQSDTDTETILHLYEDEGADCVKRLRGMFAFAIWDARRQSLFIARDRLGKKPLFYYAGGRSLVFGSEPKALLQHPDVPAEADPDSIHQFLAYGYVPAPRSAFKGIQKLPAAHYLVAERGRVSVHRYWSLHYADKLRGSDDALTEQGIALLTEAVRLRMISDVPLGALLSGGIDSATIVALMRRLTNGPIRTFSIGFEQPEYDELQYARLVAERFATEHHEEIVRPSAVGVLPQLIWHYNEPFADSSAVPSFAVARMARRQVTVALAGDGGDESFLGYERYLAASLTSPVRMLPIGVRAAVARAVARLPAGAPKSASNRLRRFTEVMALSPIRQYAGWIACVGEAARHELYTADFAARTADSDPMALLERAYQASDAPTFVEASAHADIQLYLPDDLLVKMDIASMASSLEVRSPFLDHEVVEFAARLPRRLKLRGLAQKHLLKRAMTGVLPDAVLRRKKMGFGVPIDHWFRGELKELAYDVLLDSRAVGRGYFRPDVVRRYLDEHVQGVRHHHTALWALLMLELWHRMFIDQPGPVSPPAGQ